MVKTGPFYKRFCAHTAMAGFVITWIIGLAHGVSLERIFVRSLLATVVFWVIGAFMVHWAFRPRPDEPNEPGQKKAGPASDSTPP